MEEKWMVGIINGRRRKKVEWMDKLRKDKEKMSKYLKDLYCIVCSSYYPSFGD